MIGVLAAVFLLLALPQEKGMKELIELLGSPEAEIRDRASQEILFKWNHWSLGDLELLAEAMPGDPEVSARAREALARVRLRRALGESLLKAISGLESACLSHQEDNLLLALDRAEQLLQKNGIEGADMVLLLRWISEQKWTERVEEKVGALAKKGFVADPKLVLPLLKEEDPTRRLSALGTLARLRARPLAGWVVPLLVDPNPDVRHQAARTLATLRARDQAPAIALLLEKSPDARFRATELLGDIGAREVAGKLLPSLKDPLITIRRSAIRSLAKMRARDYSGDLLPLLGDPIPTVRREAIEALGTLEATSEIPKLQTLLQSKDVALRAAAAAALGELRSGGDAVVPLLKDPDREVRQKAVAALGRAGDRKFASTLQPLLSDEDLWVRASAVEALGQIAEPAELDAILPFVKHQDPLLREKSIEALGRMGAVGSRKLVTEALKDPEGRVRAAALRALERLPGPDAQNLAQSQLQDQHPSVRQAAVALLEALRTLDSLDAVRALLRDEDPRVRLQAAEAFSTMGGGEDFLEILSLLDDPLPWVRARVAPRIGEWGSRLAKGVARERAVAALRTAEREVEWEVEAGAGIGLLYLGEKDQQAERGLIEQFQSPGLTSETALSRDLLDALCRIHEKDAFDRYVQRRRDETCLDSAEAFVRLLKSRDLDLVPGSEIRIAGRLPEGRPQSLRDIVRLSVSPKAFWLSGKTLTLTTWHEALEHWYQRLRE